MRPKLIEVQVGEHKFGTCATVDLQIERLRTERRRHAERSSGNQALTPAIKMLIGDWYVDELGMLTREISARGN